MARSTFRSQNAQNTPVSDHFWKLRCQKKRMPLWREAHFEVKRCKTPHVRATFGGSDVVSRVGNARFVNVALTRCGLLHVSRFPDGSDAVRKDTRAVTVCLPRRFAGNCLFDMASKGCGQKDTQSEQALLSGDRSPTHEVTNRDCHMPLTTHFFL